MFSSWGGWSRSSENIQESRSNDPASEGLHLITLIIVLQLEVIWGWFWIINRSSNTSIKKSRMNREVHVRFCERFRGEIPLYLLDFYLFQFSRFYFRLRFCTVLKSETILKFQLCQNLNNSKLQRLFLLMIAMLNIISVSYYKAWVIVGKFNFT